MRVRRVEGALGPWGHAREGCCAVGLGIGCCGPVTRDSLAQAECQDPQPSESERRGGSTSQRRGQAPAPAATRHDRFHSAAGAGGASASATSRCRDAYSLRAADARDSDRHARSPRRWLRPSGRPLAARLVRHGFAHHAEASRTIPFIIEPRERALVQWRPNVNAAARRCLPRTPWMASRREHGSRSPIDRVVLMLGRFSANAGDRGGRPRRPPQPRTRGAVGTIAGLANSHRDPTFPRFQGREAEPLVDAVAVGAGLQPRPSRSSI